MLRHTKQVVAAALVICSGLGLSSTAAYSADMGMSMASITIVSPKDGATLSAMGENKMDYEIKLGAGDDHFHVWVDGERGGPVRDLKGSYTLPKMTPGKHAIIVKIVDKAHVPTDPEKSVFVKVE
jgi:hypothetical protein